MVSSTNPVLARRRAGVLLHVSSLPVGLGRGGRAFIDWLASAGFTVWQILPLGPTGAVLGALGLGRQCGPDRSGGCGSDPFQ
jgi:4-alpha-glucanotransferase